MNIGIINNGIGNLGSVISALDFYRYNVNLVENLKEIKESDFLILTGVGNFTTAVSKLKSQKLWEMVNEDVVDNKKPILGICLGMQLFANISYEDGETSGFGWIEGEVRKIKGNGIKIPHIGWNQIYPVQTILFEGLRYNTFYYMHSYHFIPKNKNVIIATTKYGDLEIVAAVRTKNIIGVQFHPEKSQGDGLRLFKNILEEYK